MGAPDPIPQRPAGYFATKETPTEYQRANRLAALSPDKPECADSQEVYVMVGTKERSGILPPS